MEMEAENENPSQPNRFHLDEVQQSNIIEWNKKRKLQIDQLDFRRPRHKCWARRFSSDDNLEFASMHKFMVKSETYDSALQDSISEPKSSRGSNSFGEDSDTAMSVNEEAKLQIGFERESSYDDDDDIQALMNLEEHSLALGMCSDYAYSKYAKEGNGHSIEQELEFEDVFTTYGANVNMYILSSGKWNVNQGMLFPLECV